MTLVDTPELRALAKLTGISPVKLAAACELLKPEPRPIDKSRSAIRLLTTV